MYVRRRRKHGIASFVAVPDAGGLAVVMVPSVAATAAIGVALAQGALAASFSVSGQQFKVTAETLHG